MKNLKNVSEFVKGINKGTFGITLIAMTVPSDMKKGLEYNRSTKEYRINNPYFGRVKKISYTANVALGYDYENYIEARAKKLGLNVTDFKAEKPKGKTWFDHPYLLVSDDDATKHYLRCYYRPNTITKVIWLVDGRLATASEIEVIKSFIPEKKVSAKQESFGFTSETEVVVRDYSFDSVVALYQGDKVYNRLDGLFTIEQMKQMFK